MLMRFVAVLLALVAFGTTAVHAQTDAYPSRRIHIVVGFPPGGGVDVAGRLVADKLTRLFGQPVVVENRPGASSGIATRYVAAAKPDGYVVLINSNSMLANQIVSPNAGYDVERDLVPVIKAVSQSSIMVAGPDLAVTTLQDVIALSRRQDVTYGTPGAGSIPHLAAERLFALAGAKLRHVPYPGAAPALNGVLGGHVHLGFLTTPPAVTLVKSGKLKGIAVTAASRAATLPDIPTFAESGFPGYVVDVWGGFFVPAGTPRPVVETLSHAMAKVLAMQDVKDKLVALGFELAGTPGEEFRREISEELKLWTDIVQKSNLKL